MELTVIGSENAKAFRHLFGGLKYRDYTLCVGAIEEDRAAGVAAFSEMGDAVFLDYIYVAEDFRRRGIATGMLEETIVELKNIGLTALHVNYPEKASDIHRFILSRGFRILRDGKAYRAKAGDFIDSATSKKLLSGSVKNRVLKLSELSDLEKKSIKTSLKKNELDPKIINDSSLSDSLSLVSIDKKDGKPAGMVLCKQNEDTIALSYLVNFTDNPMILLDILKALKKAIIKDDLLEHDLVFITMNDDMIKLPEKLMESEELLAEEGDVISGIRMLYGWWD